MRLAVNFATRGRPQALVNTILETAAAIRGDTIIMVSADEDDTATLDALSTLTYPIHLSVKPREDTIAAKYNRALTEIPDADIYLPMSDHTAFVTPGFDDLVCAMSRLWPDGIGLVVNQTTALHCSTVQAITRKFAEAMGHIFPEYFPYWFTDPWLFDIAKLIDRYAFVPVQISKPVSYPTQEMREVEWWTAFYNSLASERRGIAWHLLGLLQEPDWRKAVAMTRWPLFEEQSGRIVSGYAPRGESPEPDARYLRIKAAAVKRFGGAQETK